MSVALTLAGALVVAALLLVWRRHRMGVEAHPFANAATLVSPTRSGGMRYANVTSTIALIVALGGTSYAAVKLPRDSVGARQIAADAVRSSEVRDGAIRRADLAAGVVPTPSPLTAFIARNTVGSGSGCDAGEECTVPSQANCPEGLVALGGSVEAPDGFGDMRVVVNRPVANAEGSPAGWYGVIKYTANASQFGQPSVYVICAKL